MSEEKQDDSIQLFIQHQKDINVIRDNVTELIKQDLGLGHKMDMLMTEQRLLKERVEEGVSKTASKTYEMVNQIFGQIKDMAGDNKIRDHKIQHNENINEWIVRGFVISVSAALIGGVVIMTLKWIH